MKSPLSILAILLQIAALPVIPLTVHVPIANSQSLISSESGLKYVDLSQGTGIQAKNGDRVSVHYTGWLAKPNGDKGTQFDSSVSRGRPFVFTLGNGQVIKGWDLGVAGMKVGSKRTLFIPSQLGYGTRGMGPIPPNSPLIFDVELLGISN